MTLNDLIHIAREFARLGDAVGAQVDHVAEGEPYRANPNALAMIDRWLRTVESRIDDPESDLSLDVERARVVIADAVR